MKTCIDEKKIGRLKNPILIVGLPGIGLIGRVAVKYMIDKLKAKHIATLYSNHFPPQVLMMNDGTMKLFENHFYLYRGKKRDILFLVGDIQPTTSIGQFEVADEIVKFMVKYRVKEVITIGGFSTGKLDNPGRIFGVVTSKSFKKDLKKLGIVFGVAQGSIVGMAGILPALASREGIKGICLLGETHGGFVDAGAAEKIVNILSKYIGFKIDMSELKKAAAEGEEIIKKIEEEIKKEISKQSGKELTYIR